MSQLGLEESCCCPLNTDHTQGREYFFELHWTSRTIGTLYKMLHDSYNFQILHFILFLRPHDFTGSDHILF